MTRSALCSQASGRLPPRPSLAAVRSRRRPLVARSAIPKCATSGLVVWMDTNGNGAAGTIYYELQFTNLSGQTCTLTGYPGVSAVKLNGTAVRQRRLHATTRSRRTRSASRTATRRPQRSESCRRTTSAARRAWRRTPRACGSTRRTRPPRRSSRTRSAPARMQARSLLHVPGRDLRRPSAPCLPFRQRVQTYARFATPFTSTRTRWRFGLKRRFVATIECDRLCPNPGFFPQTEQTLDTAAPV